MIIEIIEKEKEIKKIYCPECKSVDKFELYKIDDNTKIFQCCSCERQYKVSKEKEDIDYKEL